jgi:catechol 2,3-dioxygenase-like lactoylglutathione lyase family enzyme
MNRFHLHLNVADLDASIRFYSQLFGSAPSVTKPDYAKWMLDDPRVNFAISTTGCAPGIDHLGIQVDDPAALKALGQRLHAAGSSVVPEPSTTCCYARSDKLWTEDPQGTRWETFHTFGEATTYYAEAPCNDEAACAPAPIAATAGKSACCAPESSCC